MTGTALYDPPRNGEVASRRDDGVAGAGVDPTTSYAGPPPRSGEDRKRSKHRTVGATDDNIRLARQLRRTMTLPEVLLWNALRLRPDNLKFRKQFPLVGYVADFACLTHRLIVEIDGESHSRGDQPQRDAARDAIFKSEGFRVMRIAARDVLANVDAVVRGIVARCAEVGPVHQPSAGRPPRSGEELR